LKAESREKKLQITNHKQISKHKSQTNFKTQNTKHQTQLNHEEHPPQLKLQASLNRASTRQAGAAGEEQEEKEP